MTYSEPELLEWIRAILKSRDTRRRRVQLLLMMAGMVVGSSLPESCASLRSHNHHAGWFNIVQSHHLARFANPGYDLIMLRSPLFTLIALVLVILPLLGMGKHAIADDANISDTSSYSFSVQDDIADPELIVSVGISLPQPIRRTEPFRSLSLACYRNPDYATPLRPPCA